MNKSTKFLGVVLILVTATCLVAGGVNLSSTLNDKNYWENKGAKATADLDTLEAGLNTLKSNQKAYEDGRIAYQTGLADYQKGQDDLKKGQEEYDAGLATLNSKQLEYNAGLAELQAAEQQLAAGKQTLDENYQAYIDGKAQIAQYEQGQRDYEQGLADYNAGQANVKNGTAALIAAASANAGYDLGTLDAAEQYVAASETKLKQVQPIVETAGSGILSVKSDYEKWQSDYAKISPFQSKTSSNLPLSNSTKDEYLQAVSSEANADALKTLINRLLTEMPNIASRASTALWNGINFENDVIAELDREGLNGSQAMNAILNYLFGVPSSDADGFQAAMNKIAVVSNATINLYYNGTRDVAAFNAGEAELNTGKAQLAAAEPQLAAAKQTLDANYAAYVAGKAKIAEYEQGLAEYNAGLAEYNEGKAKLDDGAAQLAATKPSTASSSLSPPKPTATSKVSLTASAPILSTSRITAISTLPKVSSPSKPPVISLPTTPPLSLAISRVAPSPLSPLSSRERSPLSSASSSSAKHKKWSRLTGSNCRPTVYKTVALTN